MDFYCFSAAAFAECRRRLPQDKIEILGRALGCPGTTADSFPSLRNCKKETKTYILPNAIVKMTGARPKAALVGLRLTCHWRAAEGRLVDERLIVAHSFSGPVASSDPLPCLISSLIHVPCQPSVNACTSGHKIRILPASSRTIAGREAPITMPLFWLIYVQLDTWLQQPSHR